MSRSSHTPAFPFGGWIVVTASFSAGFLISYVAGFGFSALLTGIISATISYASYGRIITAAIRRSVFFAVILLVLGNVAVFTTGIPWLSALSMAIIAFVLSLLTATAPLGISAALLSSTGYLLLAGLALLFVEDQGMSPLLLSLTVVLGALIGVVMSLVSSFVLRVLTKNDAFHSAQAMSLHSMLSTTTLAVRELRRAPRDGIRRAVALGVAMFIFQSVPAHDGYLLLITAAIVLPVYGRVALMTVGSRLLSSFMAIGIALIFPFILPRPTVAVIAVIAITVAITSALRSTTVSLVAACIAYLLLIGAPGLEIGIYAGWRLIDAAGGFLIAWLAGYVLWPKQPLLITPIPRDLHLECELVEPTLGARA